jgi:hypothetical protein
MGTLPRNMAQQNSYLWEKCTEREEMKKWSRESVTTPLPPYDVCVGQVRPAGLGRDMGIVASALPHTTQTAYLSHV